MFLSQHIARFSDGERFPYLEGQDGLMSLWPTLFTFAKSRSSKTANTILNELSAIAHLGLWEKMEKRNLLEELGRQHFPTEEDIMNIRDHCHRDSLDLKRYLNRAKYQSGTLVGIVAPTQTVSLQKVEKSHAYNRITVIANYLYFCAVTMLRVRPNTGELNSHAKEMHQALLAQRPKGKASRTGLAIHPSPQYFDEFMSVVAEDSPDNPFNSREVRSRNFVMFQTLYETGVRSGELLSQYVGDATYDGQGDPIIRIIDRRDDPNDPRINPPQVKTLERDISISQGLYDKIQEYITSVRYYTPNARKRPFLFVNHRADEFQGFPMSDKNFQHQLKRVVEVRPDKFKDIRRHGFRHNFNVRLTDQLDLYSIQEKPLTDKQRLDIRKDMNGHAGDKSGEIYERNAIRVKANRAVRQYQDKQSSMLKEALAEVKGSVGDDKN